MMDVLTSDMADLTIDNNATVSAKAGKPSEILEQWCTIKHVDPEFKYQGTYSIL